jgi:hypothetical protein
MDHSCRATKSARSTSRTTIGPFCRALAPRSLARQRGSATSARLASSFSPMLMGGHAAFSPLRVGTPLQEVRSRFHQETEVQNSTSHAKTKQVNFGPFVQVMCSEVLNQPYLTRKANDAVCLLPSPLGPLLIVGASTAFKAYTGGRERTRAYQANFLAPHAAR